MSLDFGYSRLRNIRNQGSVPGFEFEHLGGMMLPGEICWGDGHEEFHFAHPIRISRRQPPCEFGNQWSNQGGSTYLTVISL